VVTVAKTKQFIPINGSIGREEIELHAQTPNCFPSFEINPAIGCEFGCIYCSMYGQEAKLQHVPVKVFVDYPEYLEEFIRKHKNEGRLVFNFTPKSDAFSPALIESGVTGRILDVLIESNCEFYSLTKSGIPEKRIQKKLIEAKDLAQIVISTGLPNEDYRKILEPNAPNIEERMNFAKFCKQNEILVSGIAAPFLPFSIPNYHEIVINRFSEVGIDHVSVHMLKLSELCLERMSNALGDYGSLLKKMYLGKDNKTVVWSLPGGKKITRYYCDAEIIRKELAKLKEIAKTKGVTLSTCVQVEQVIQDTNFNDQARKRGITCVGFRTRK
jgi:DNA repair photolyase